MLICMSSCDYRFGKVVASAALISEGKSGQRPESYLILSSTFTQLLLPSSFILSTSQLFLPHDFEFLKSAPFAPFFLHLSSIHHTTSVYFIVHYTTTALHHYRALHITLSF